LDDVLFQIAIRSRRPETGIKNYFEIRNLVDEYAHEDAPRHRHPVSPDDWFYCRHKRWLIFYRLHGEGIEVMRIIDGSRDLPRQFSDG
jgi:plasmid stabilization system protein ParE